LLIYYIDIKKLLNTKIKMKKRLLLVIYFFIFSLSILAQTNISGTINAYANVTNINITKTIITIGATSGSGSFANGDRILVIQMKGATIDDQEGNTYGQILNYNNAGNFEFATISNVSGNNITLTQALVKNFSFGANDFTQIVRMPTYTNANVNGLLSGLAWNGSVGGVLAFRVTGTLTLNDNISMNGMGFRGGNFSTPAGNCSVTTYRTNSTTLGYKGEGIAVEPNGNINGRGALANGGGGGNGHNAGGGGGSNVGQGGIGGREWAGPLYQGWCGVQDGTCNNINNLVGGLGGYVLNSNTSGKIFLGGGGGGGQQDNNTSSAGGNGGGIIIIIANTITTGINTRTISSNGNDALNAQWDGAGGGGAGGSILISANNFTGNLLVNANGGKGGNTLGCHGPGGGGGGGFIQYTNNITTYLNVVSSAIAGVNGTQPQGTTCGDPAVAVGENYCGTVSPFAAGTVINSTPLPVRLVVFSGKNIDNYNLLYWQTIFEENNSHFTIERSKDAQNFIAIGEKDGAGNSLTTKEYTFKDENILKGWNYYRLKQSDYNGQFTYSNIIAIKNNIETNVEIFPNPSENGWVHIQLSAETQPSQTSWQITDLQGKILKENQPLESNLTKIDFSNLPKGIYILSIRTPEKVWQKKLLLQ
jgi:hypothetical protein